MRAVIRAAMRATIRAMIRAMIRLSSTVTWSHDQMVTWPQTATCSHGHVLAGRMVARSRGHAGSRGVTRGHAGSRGVTR
eukprot:5058559-Prymnesium_polylepis.1